MDWIILTIGCGTCLAAGIVLRAAKRERARLRNDYSFYASDFNIVEEQGKIRYIELTDRETKRRLTFYNKIRKDHLG